MNISDSALGSRATSEVVAPAGITRRLEYIIATTQRAGGVFPHLLFDAPPGFGKQRLARGVAAALGIDITINTATEIKNAGQLAGILTSLESGALLFIDEIDRIHPDIFEYLYSSLQHFEFNIVIDNRPEARTLHLKLPRFTCIGATTDFKNVSPRLLGCFAETLHFGSYTTEELRDVLHRSSNGIGFATDNVLGAIAARCGGSPLEAKNLLLRLRDLSESTESKLVSEEAIESALNLFAPLELAPANDPNETTPPLEPHDHAFELRLRPNNLADFVGQRAVCEPLHIMMTAAKSRGEVLDHLLFCGQAGLGKTTLAHLVASALEAAISVVDAPRITDSNRLFALMASLRDGDVLLVEELHRLSPSLEKSFRTAMQDRYVDLVFDEGPQARVVRKEVPRLTIIATVPRGDLIPDTLRARFPAAFAFRPYGRVDISALITRTAAALEVDVDEQDLLDFTAHSYGSPRRAIDCIRLAMPRLELSTAVSRSRWEALPRLVSDMLWRLAEARPDFEELPAWIAQAEAAVSGAAHSQRATTAIAHGRAVVRSVANRYGNEDDRVAVGDWDSKFIDTVPEAPFTLSQAVEQAQRFRGGVRQLPLAIHDDVLCIGQHSRISFNRTLRIPEDGKRYPLPAGFGKLPILRVEDYVGKIPAKWVSEGGFIIPLYQREALFLEFNGAKWRPAIAKVSVGRVNAVSGKPHDMAVRSHRQDYVVIPDQQWLDGISSGDGAVSQFVAMPLGEGYTIEAQVTDEEKHGGFQIVMFDPRNDRFPDLDPVERAVAADKRNERALRAGQQAIRDSLSAADDNLIRLLQTYHYVEAAERLTVSPEQVLEIVDRLRSEFESILGHRGFDGLVPAAHLERRLPATLRSQPLFMPDTGEPPRLGAAKPRSAAVKEMGIAAGGLIQQQIIEDEYGADSWDPDAFREVVIHIVNSAVFEEITGRAPPETPITVAKYQEYRIPWFSKYDEKVSTVGAAAIFRRILSVGQIDRQRGLKTPERPIREVSEEEILRVRVPTLEDRLNALMKRAQQSLHAGRFKIAAREASLAADIVPGHPLPLLLRAHANLRLGFHADAEADASSCLERDPTNISALGLRALSCLALGELLLAKNDASKVLESHPLDKDALFVRAQANLGLSRYQEAFDDANILLQHDSSNAEAIRIKAEAITHLS